MSATTPARTTAFDRKLRESYRLSDLVDGISVSYWPNMYNDGDPKGSAGNLFGVDIDSDVTTEVFIDWRDAVKGNMSLALCARLLLVAEDIEGKVRSILDAEGLDREAAIAVLAKIKERYGE